MGKPLFRALVRRAPEKLDTQLRSYAIYGTEQTMHLTGDSRDGVHLTVFFGLMKLLPLLFSQVAV